MYYVHYKGDLEDDVADTRVRESESSESDQGELCYTNNQNLGKVNYISYVINNILEHE